MSQPEVPAAKPRSTLRWALGIGGLLLALLAFWFAFGRGLWDEIDAMRRDSNRAEESTPVAYKGMAFRRSYNDRPSEFHFERDGRKLLWAAKGGVEGPDFYDVSDCEEDLSALAGGFGRDSIAGIDWPIIEEGRGPIVQQLGPHEVFGVVLDQGPRGYPLQLLQKTHIANDRDGEVPLVVVLLGNGADLRTYSRSIGGKTVTFGTTGYLLKLDPLLYDRATRGLWLPRADALVCVSGPHRGKSLPTYRPAEKTTWRAWRGKHANSTALVGSDRKLPEDPLPVE